MSEPDKPHARRVLHFAFAFKKAALSAFVSLVLFSLMVGIRTEAGPTGQLIYWTRFDELAGLVAATFVGSLVIELVRQWLGPAGTSQLVPASVQNGIAFAGRLLPPALLIFTLLVPVIFYDQRYILDLAILVLTYVMLGWGLNVVVGLAGLLDLGYVAFYAVGAYSYALLATTFDLSFWVCLPLAGLLASLCLPQLALLGRDLDAAAIRHRMRRVVAEVEDHLLQLGGLAADHQLALGMADGELDARGQRDLEQRRDLSHHVA